MKKQRLFLLAIFFTALLLGSCTRRLYLPIASKQSLNLGDIQVPATQSENEPLAPTFQGGYQDATPSQEQATAEPTTLIQPTQEISPTVNSRVLLPYLSKPYQPTQANWLLVPRILQGNKETDKYILNLQHPVISGETSPFSIGFNQQIQTWINSETNQFFNSTQATSANDLGGYMLSTYSIPSSMAWSFGAAPVNYQNPPPTLEAAQVIWDGGAPIISILMTVSEYYGGAHPGERHFTLNVDSQTGKLLELNDLFENSGDYLATIARYAANELYRRADLLPQGIDRGAAPLIENYQVWNITPRGLLITFEDYQVGPYAAGAQQVLVPYEVLRNVLRRDGPLSKFATSG